MASHSIAFMRAARLWQASRRFVQQVARGVGLFLSIRDARDGKGYVKIIGALRMLPAHQSFASSPFPLTAPRRLKAQTSRLCDIRESLRGT